MKWLYHAFSIQHVRELLFAETHCDIIDTEEPIHYRNIKTRLPVE
jgi:hypothetical protein